MDDIYQALREREIERQIERMLKSRNYTLDEMAWITNTSVDFVENVRTRTYAGWIVRLYQKILNGLVWLSFIAITLFVFGLIFWGVINQNA